MLMKSPQYAFIAGEVSPEFHGRTDLVKYSVGAKLMKNWFVGHRGGAYTRQGTRYMAPLPATEETLLHRFRATGDDYCLVFTDLKLRVMRSGGYILTGDATVTGITKADPGVVTTSASHGYTTGDWVYLSGTTGMPEVDGVYLRVGSTTSTTFELLKIDGTNFDTSAFDAAATAGDVAKVYTLTTTYATADVPHLHIEQDVLDFTITHTSYPPRRLTYTADDNWAIADINFGTAATAPTNLAVTSTGSGNAEVAFAITSIVDGAESLSSDYKFLTSSVDYTSTAGSAEVTWDAVTGADWYHVYRSLVINKADSISYAHELGYLGRALGPRFTDTNIIPDFTKTPPLNYNPFANYTIESVDVTAGGSGYTNASSVSMSGGGTGFVGYPVINASGALVDVVVVNGGSGYDTSPAVSVTVGSGATADVTVGPASGNYPGVFRQFQQRAVYAGSLNYPMTIWGSKPGLRDNFDVSFTVNAGDSYSYVIDSREPDPINHMLALRSGLLLFTQSGVWQLKASEGLSINPVSAIAEPQAYQGVAEAHPMAVGLDVLFVQEIGSALMAMMYTEYTNTFALQNLSALSNHLMSEQNELTRTEFVEAPDKLIYALREDGVLLTLTYDREQEVFGWAQHETKGRFKDICALRENGAWSLYVAVERYVDGSWVKMMERIKSREFDRTEDYWGVDAGLSRVLTEPAAEATFGAITGTGVTVTADASVFVSGDVGKVIFAGGGKATVASYVSGTEITVDFVRDMDDILYQDANNTPFPVPSGEWSMDATATVLQNLHHLEGETLSILADGEYVTKTVSGGAITLDTAATKIIAGLKYTCDLESLSLISSQGLIEDARKDIVSVAGKMWRTRGLEVGATFSDLYGMKDTDSLEWDSGSLFRTDLHFTRLSAEWEEETTVCFRQSNPYPATVLNVVSDYIVGDD